jgi:hypothetical protein
MTRNWMDTPEGGVVKECLAWLETQGYHVLKPKTDLRGVIKILACDRSKRGVFWRQNTGVAKLRGKGGKMQPVRFGVAGQPDIAGILRWSFPSQLSGLDPDRTIAQYVGIECKAEGGRLSGKQEAYGDLIEALGGCVILAYGYEDLERAGL